MSLPIGMRFRGAWDRTPNLPMGAPSQATGSHVDLRLCLADLGSAVKFSRPLADSSLREIVQKRDILPETEDIDMVMMSSLCVF